nr:immunoglobulin heavy chain junction region [Macaca mulatta]
CVRDEHGSGLGFW